MFSSAGFCFACSQAACTLSMPTVMPREGFAFSMCGIAVGEEIEFCCAGNEHSGEICTVRDDKHVTYKGEIWSLSALAKYLAGRKTSAEGPKYFKYKGEWLNDIRRRNGL